MEHLKNYTVKRCCSESCKNCKKYFILAWGGVGDIQILLLQPEKCEKGLFFSLNVILENQDMGQSVPIFEKNWYLDSIRGHLRPIFQTPLFCQRWPPKNFVLELKSGTKIAWNSCLGVFFLFPGEGKSWFSLGYVLKTPFTQKYNVYHFCRYCSMWFLSLSSWRNLWEFWWWIQMYMPYRLDWNTVWKR